MTSYLQVLGAAGPDSPPSLLLFFDTSRYLINAPEGTQRLATQHQIKLSKLHHILCTRSSTLTLGGLPGLAITLADLGVKRLTVSGSEGGVAGVMRGVRLFSVRRGMETDVREMSDGDEYKDERVTIRAVVMGAVTRRMRTTVDEQHRRQQQPHTATADTTMAAADTAADSTLHPPAEKRFRPAAEEKSSAYHSEDDLAISSAELSSHSQCAVQPQRPASPATSFEPTVTQPFTVSTPVLSFIFSLASTPGKFDPVRAKALGLKPGPLFAQLKAGQPVWLDDDERKENTTEEERKGEKRGRLVHPRECVGPVRSGAEVAVIDIPWRNHSSRLHRWVYRLRHNSTFSHYHTTTSASSSPPSSLSTHRQLTAVVHLCGMAVLKHPLYIEWMSLFGPSTQHVLINHVLAVPRSVFTSSEQHHCKLQTLSHSLFCCSSSPAASSSSSSLHAGGVAGMSTLPASTVAGETLMRINLLPVTGSAEREQLPDLPAADTTAGQQWNDKMIQFKREAWDALCRDTTHTNQSSSCSSSSSSLSSLSPAALITSTLPVSPHSHLPLLLPLPLSDELHSAAPPTDFTPDPHIIRRLALLPRSHSPHVTFLGTGSAIPSKYRNVTGIFFHPGQPSPPHTLPPLPTTPDFTMSDSGSGGGGRSVDGLMGGWLLDCGEGTLGQCVRKWGVKGARDVLGALRVAFISHMHADHHLGLPAVIGLYVQEERKRRAVGGGGEAARRLVVVGPRKLVAWLSAHWQHTYEEHTCDVDNHTADIQPRHAVDADMRGEEEDEQADVVDDDLFDFIDFYPNHLLTTTPHPLSPLLASFPLPCSLTTIPVRHCPDSYAVSIHTTSTSAAALRYKLVYSGDTLPCQSLIDGGSHATLLLHESTFEDGMESEAREKRHCTARQAVNVAMKMHASRTILTHFSQRYPKLADVSGNSSGGSGSGGGDGVVGWMSERCAIAFDLMSVDWCDLYWLPQLTPAFADVLANDDTDDDDTQQPLSEQQQTALSDVSRAVNKAAVVATAGGVKDKRKGVDTLPSSSVNGSHASTKRKNAQIAAVQS